MLRRDELARWAATFGVADEQVRRDHLISHVLAALAALDGGSIVLYGGTALARTHLPAFRLSEDVDLLVDPRREWADRVEHHLPGALRRQFGTVTWDPVPSRVPEGAPARLVAGAVSVRLQLVALDAEQARWPVERRSLEMRYADAPPTEMVVPTRSAFAAMKTLAWADRHAPRDLADLAALAPLGALDAEAAALVADMGGWQPTPAMFDLPDATRATWTTDLAHQMASLPDPDACVRAVRGAWSEVTGKA
jgi:nucleotidyltransferase AbiEii toxin of type IV toxin-antitoxin system